MCNLANEKLLKEHELFAKINHLKYSIGQVKVSLILTTTQRKRNQNNSNLKKNMFLCKNDLKKWINLWSMIKTIHCLGNPHWLNELRILKIEFRWLKISMRHFNHQFIKIIINQLWLKDHKNPNWIFLFHQFQEKNWFNRCLMEFQFIRNEMFHLFDERKFQNEKTKKTSIMKICMILKL